MQHLARRKKSAGQNVDRGEISETCRAQGEKSIGPTIAVLDRRVSSQSQRVLRDTRHFILGALGVLRGENRIATEWNRPAGNDGACARCNRHILDAALASDQRARPPIDAIGDRERGDERGDADDHSRRGKRRARWICPQRVRSDPCRFEDCRCVHAEPPHRDLLLRATEDEMRHVNLGLAGIRLARRRCETYEANV